MSESEVSQNTTEVAAPERRHSTHKRMERWIRLQQFVFGLPDDYSYAICTTALPGGKFRSRSLVKVGWMNWYGAGNGNDRQHSLAVALLGSAEALSANSTLVFWHSFAKWMRRGLGRFRFGRNAGTKSKAGDKAAELELMAG